VKSHPTLSMLTATLLLAGMAGAGETPAAPPPAEKLIAAFLAPVPAAEPSAAQRAELERAMAGFSAEKFEDREQASAAVVRLDTAALTALRPATGDKDLEVAKRAEEAVAAIEKRYREGLAAELVKIGESAGPLLKARIDEQQRAWARLAMSVPAAERAGNQAEVERLKAEMAAASARADALKALQEQMLRAAAAAPPRDS
jgi:hypothetical protein